MPKARKEYQRFYETDDRTLTFADTITVFEVFDTVEVEGKQYEVEAFYKSAYAKPNEVDWLRLRRIGSHPAAYLDVCPSEATLISRPVLSARGKSRKFYRISE